MIRLNLLLLLSMLFRGSWGCFRQQLMSYTTTADTIAYQYCDLTGYDPLSNYATMGFTEDNDYIPKIGFKWANNYECMNDLSAFSSAASTDDLSSFNSNHVGRVSFGYVDNKRAACRGIAVKIAGNDGESNSCNNWFVFSDFTTLILANEYVLQFLSLEYSGNSYATPRQIVTFCRTDLYWLTTPPTTHTMLFGSSASIGYSASLTQACTGSSILYSIASVSPALSQASFSGSTLTVSSSAPAGVYTIDIEANLSCSLDSNYNMAAFTLNPNTSQLVSTLTLTICAAGFTVSGTYANINYESGIGLQTTANPFTVTQTGCIAETVTPILVVEDPPGTFSSYVDPYVYLDASKNLIVDVPDLEYDPYSGLTLNLAYKYIGQSSGTEETTASFQVIFASTGPQYPCLGADPSTITLYSIQDQLFFDIDSDQTINLDSSFVFPSGQLPVYSAYKLVDGLRDPLPTGITLDLVSQAFIVLPDLEVGIHNIELVVNVACDPSYEWSITFKIDMGASPFIIPANTAPMFSEELPESFLLNITEAFEYFLPAPFDLENDEVTLDIDLGAAFVFMSVDNVTGQILVEQNAVTESMANKEFEVAINLIDSNGAITSYSIMFTINEFIPEEEEVLEIKVLEEEEEFVFEVPIEEAKPDPQAVDAEAQNSEAMEEMLEELLEKLGGSEFSVNGPVPRIQTISFRGEVKVRFSKEMAIPQNFTEIETGTIKKDGKVVPSLQIIVHFKDLEMKQNYTWSVQEFEGKQVIIKMEFEKPGHISMSGTDYLEIIFNDNWLFADTSNRTVVQYESIKRNLPPQIDLTTDIGKAFAAMNEAAGESSGAAAAAAASMSFIAQLSLNQVWSMIDTLQILVMIPLVRSSQPANIWQFLAYLLTIAAFDLVDSDGMYGLAFEFDDAEPSNPNFAIAGFGSIGLLPNVGSMLLFFLLNYLVLLTYLILRCYSKLCCISKLRYYIKKTFIWNATLSLYTESYAILVLAAMINGYQPNWSGAGEITNSVLSYLIMLISFAFPILLTKYTIRMQSALQYPIVQDKYATFYDGYQTSKKRIVQLVTSLNYYYWRRFFFCVVLVFTDTLIYQLVFLCLTKIISLSVYIVLKPKENPNDNRKEIFNESLMLIYCYHHFLFTDFISIHQRTQVGYVALVIVQILIAFNLCKVLWGTISGYIKSIKTWRQNKILERKIRESRRHTEQMKNKHLLREIKRKKMKQQRAASSHQVLEVNSEVKDEKLLQPQRHHSEELKQQNKEADDIRDQEFDPWKDDSQHQLSPSHNDNSSNLILSQQPTALNSPQPQQQKGQLYTFRMTPKVMKQEVKPSYSDKSYNEEQLDNFINLEEGDIGQAEKIDAHDQIEDGDLEMKDAPAPSQAQKLVQELKKLQKEITTQDHQSLQVPQQQDQNINISEENDSVISIDEILDALENQGQTQSTGSFFNIQGKFIRTPPTVL